MRIYNGTNSQIDLPLSNNVRLSIAAKTPSKDFAPNPDFLSLVVTSFDDKEIALIVSGPFELSMCSTIPATAPILVQSLDEAIERFTPKKKADIEKKVGVVVEDIAKPEKEVIPDQEDVLNDTVIEKPEKKARVIKKSNKN